MRNYNFLLITLLLVLLFNACTTKNQKTQDSDSVTVDVIKPKGYEISRTQVIPIKDSQTDRKYELFVKLPEGYAENNDIKYPVIYFTDARWHIDILSASTEYIMENAIIVGISWEKDLKGELGTLGAHASRFRDYQIQPSSNQEAQAKYQLGQASNHRDFIRNDVIKYIENNYRTASDNRSYFGYSLGGLFGAYILLTEPDTFKNYILGSPSLKSDIPYLSKLESELALKVNDLNTNVFVSNGSLEKELSTHADTFITMLKKRNYKSLSLRHVVVEGSHQTAFPVTGVQSVTWLRDLTKE